MRHWLRATVLLALVATMACHGDTGGATRAPGPTPDATTEAVETADGLHLDARLFAADPDRLVILLHMYQVNQESWFGAARQIRDHGYSALTLDFRGYGDSDGDVEPADAVEDVRAALAFAQARGYAHVVLVGASMGGTAAIVTAASEPVDGLLTLSAPGQFRGLDADAAVRHLDVPLAMIAASGDTSSELTLKTFEDKAFVDARWALLVDGNAHGTALLDSSGSARVMAKLFEFLGAVWPPGS